MQTMTDRNRRGTRARRAAILLLAGAGLLPVAWARQDSSPFDVDGTRAALEKIVQTQRIISKEKSDWALGREILEDRIALVQNEIDTLREREAEAQTSIAEADEKRAELVGENERLRTLAGSLAESVVTLEERVRAELPRLPEPARERVELLSQRLPKDSRATELALSERYQNVIGILNQVNKFNREVSVTSEVRSLGDGSSAQVSALYVGLGQGYYVTADGRFAGVGAAGADSWEWRPADGAAKAVVRAIAIVQGAEVASFVGLPIQVD